MRHDVHKNVCGQYLSAVYCRHGTSDGMMGDYEGLIRALCLTLKVSEGRRRNPQFP